MIDEYLNLIADCGGRSEQYFVVDSEDIGNKPTEKALAKLALSGWVPQQFFDCARELNGYALEWHSDPARADRPPCRGSIYFGWPDEDPRRQAFKVVNFGMNEACVGFYHDAQQDPGLYYYELGEGHEPYPLHLDLKGYLTLLNYTMGYHCWPLAVLALLPDTGGNPAYRHSLDFSAQFRRDLEAWVPEFSWDEFMALYEQVRLRP